MKNKQEIIKKEFNGQEVAFREVDGVSEVRIDEVAKFCGWINMSKGKEYVNWTRVNGHLKTLGCAEVQNGNFIPEYIMYPLIGRAKNENATKFMLWVGQVLVEIRKHGAYISDDENNIDQDYIKYAFGQLKNTFTHCAIETLIEEYDKCMDWHKQNKTRIPYGKNSKRRKDATHSHSESKIMIMQKITSVLEERNLCLMENGKFGLVSEIDDTIKSIKDDIKKQYNISNRGKLAGATKKINKLQDEVNYHNPNIDDFVEIPMHGFSVNSMFEPKIYKGNPYLRKTDSYNNWIDRFPSKIIVDNFSDIDLDKPTKLWLKFDCMDNFDTDNLIKSIQDEIVRSLNYDNDNNISLGGVERNKKVNSYKEGKIYILLKNI